MSVTAADLLAVGATPGKRTMEGLRSNVSVGIQYLASWLRGTGAVAINNLMEDAATAEISRSQVWQWLHNDVVLDDTGERVTKSLVERLASEVEGRRGAGFVHGGGDRRQLRGLPDATGI